MTSNAPSIKQSHDVLKASISDLAVLRDQLAGIDDIKAEQQKAQAQLDALKHNVKGMNIELKEATDQYNEVCRKAHDELAKFEALQRDVKAKTDELNSINQQIQKLRERFQ
jgi:chromosome segregation ATPase